MIQEVDESNFTTDEKNKFKARSSTQGKHRRVIRNSDMEKIPFDLEEELKQESWKRDFCMQADVEKDVRDI